MNIAIYQINLDRDVNRAAFESLDDLEKYQGSSEIDSAIYDKVYEGQVSCSDLEEVYQMFNLDHPENYLGRSLSVSDIVEVREAKEVVGIVELPGGEEHRFCDLLEYMTFQDQLREQDTDFTAHDYLGTGLTKPVSRFFFCDSIGFREVSFQPDLTGKIEDHRMRVVLLEPGKLAKVAYVGTSLEAKQQVVGGDIQCMYPFAEETCIVCNEEGKLEGLPLNRAIRENNRNGESRGGEILDIIAGTCFICGLGEENLTGLTEEQAQRYAKLFRFPEQFFRTNGGIQAIPYQPNEKSQNR